MLLINDDINVSDVLTDVNLDNCDIMDETLNESAVVENEKLRPLNRLVDYSSSSESENNIIMKTSPKCKKLKKFDSDFSFHQEKDSDYFYSDSDEIARSVVGEAGLKKSKKVSKKKLNKIENTPNQFQSKSCGFM